MILDNRVGVSLEDLLISQDKNRNLSIRIRVGSFAVANYSL